MKREVWPFLVGRNRVLDYRTIVFPQFLSARSLSTLLVDAAIGDESDPDAAIFRGIHGAAVGEISILFRVVKAIGRDYDIEEKEVLRDETGRVILLIEGMVIQGYVETTDNVVVTKKDFQVVHNKLKRAYREFWKTDTDRAFSAMTSEPFLLQSGDDTDENLTLKVEPPYIISPPSLPVPSVGSRQRNRLLSITMALISFILLIVGGFFIYNWIFPRPPPLLIKTVTTFCNDVNASNEPDASKLLYKPGLLDNYEHYFQSPTTCSIDSIGNPTGTHAEAELTLTSSGHPAAKLHISLIEESNGDWKIEKIS